MPAKDLKLLPYFGSYVRIGPMIVSQLFFERIHISQRKLCGQLLYTSAHISDPAPVKRESLLSIKPRVPKFSISDRHTAADHSHPRHIWETCEVDNAACLAGSPCGRTEGVPFHNPVQCQRTWVYKDHILYSPGQFVIDQKN